MKIKQVIENGDPGNKDIAYRFFIEEKGYSPEASAGIVGNLMQESHTNLNTQALGFDGTGSFGVAQWLGKRKERLRKVRPNDYNTLKGQLEFVDWELNNTEKRAGRKLKSAKTAEEAALAFSRYYERPHRDYAHNNKRVGFANQLLSGTSDIKYTGSKNTDDNSPEAYKGMQSSAYTNKSAGATYADISEQKEENPVLQTGITEDQVRQLLAQEKQQTEQKFVNAFAQEEQPQEEQPQEEVSTENLYNFVDIESFEKGGKLPDEKDFFKNKATGADEILGVKRESNVVPKNTKVEDNNPFNYKPKTIYEEVGKNVAPVKKEELKAENNNPFNYTSPVVTLNYNELLAKDDFNSKEGVEKIQNKLVKAGYDIGSIDGKAGPKTKAAYAEFLEKGNKNRVQKNYFPEVKQGFDPFVLSDSTADQKEKLGSKEQIKELQSKLVSAGYDLGTYGSNKNGVDGVAGEKTLKAKQDYDNINSRFMELDKDTDIIKYQTSLQEQGNFKGIDIITPKDSYRTVDGKDPFKINSKNSCDTRFCTAYVGEQIEAAIGKGEDGKTKGRSSLDAYGDAWTYNSRIVNKGGQEIFSVFENSKPKIEGGKEEVEKYIQKRVDGSDKLNYNDVKAGDTLNLFYPGSAFAEQAYKEGSKYFTSHAGIVKKNDKGDLFVEHNVGGKVYKSPLQDFIDGKAKNAAGKTMAITAVVRPNYEDLKNGNKDLVNNEKVSNKESSLYNYNHNVFTQTLKTNGEALKKDLNITGSEFEGLSKAMRSIAFKESDYGDNNNAQSVARTMMGNIKEFLGAGEKSRGLTSLKDKKNLPENLRKKYIKGQGENLENPVDSAVTSFYALGARYKYLKDLNIVKGLKMNQEQLTKLSMLSWNEDVSVVAKSMEKYKTYDNVMKAYRGENGKHDYDLALVAYDDYLK